MKIKVKFNKQIETTRTIKNLIKVEVKILGIKTKILISSLVKELH